MGFEIALASSEAVVRERQLQRDVAVTMGGTSVCVVLSPLSPPRLWRLVAETVLGALDQAIGNDPPTSETLQRAIARSAATLDALRSRLIEPQLILDARMGVALTTVNGIFFASTEGVRLYRAKSSVPERLFPKATRPTGISAGPVFTAVEPVATGDLFFLGTRAAFTVRAIGNLAATLARGHAPVTDLCEAVIAPCRDAGIGASIVVLRSG